MYKRILSLILFFISIFHFVQPQPYYDVKRKTLQEGLYQLPCNNLPVMKPIFYHLSEVFNEDMQVNRITILGWYLFRGSLPVDHYLLSLHKGNTVVASISYNSDQKYINLSALSQQKQTQNTAAILLNQWNIIIFDVLLNSTHITSKGMLRVVKPPANIPLQTISDSYTPPILLSDLYLNIGYPYSSLSLIPSCSNIKDLQIQVNSDFNNNSLGLYTDYLIKSPAQLIAHFDFYYSQQNAGYLLSDKGYYHQKATLVKQNSNEDPSLFNSGDFFDTGYYSLNGKSEYIISFFLKMQQLPTSDCYIATIVNESFLIDLYVNNNSLITKYSSTIKSIDMHSLVWNYIIIIMNFQSLTTFSLLIDGMLESNRIAFFVPVQSVYLNFHFSPQCSVQINHLRIYIGSGFYSTNTCLKQSFDGTCFQCNTGDIQDFQNNMECILEDSVNKGTIVTGVKDWNPPRNKCSSNMVNDPTQQNTCQCLVGFYFDGNICQKCPSYCVYCTSLSTCTTERDPNGKCLDPALFDDGVNCKESLFTIPNQINHRITFQNPEFGTTCSNLGTDLTVFKLLSTFNSDETIFFSFGFLMQSFPPPFVTGTIATITSNSNIVLKIDLFITSSTPYIGFNVLGNNKFFKFYEFDTVWIGYWSNNNKHIFLMNTNGFSYYLEYISSSSYTNNIELTIGRFAGGTVGTADASSSCFTLGSVPFTFIKNIPYPTSNGINQMFSLMASDVNIIVQYKFDSTQSGFTTNLLNSVPASFISSKLVFTSTLNQYNDIQGFGLSKNVHAQIDSFVSWGNQGFITFSCNIEFDNSSEESFILFLYVHYADVGVDKVTFYFDVDYTLQIIRIMLCSTYGCQTTKKATLLFNQSNFLLITARDLSLKQAIQFEKVLEVDIVCNQVKETLMVSFKYALTVIDSLQITNLTGKNFLMYLDNIRIYSSYGFVYYDYNNDVRCYISFNVGSFNCIRLKKQYLYYGNTIIQREQCLQMALNENATYLINEKDQICSIYQNNSYPDNLCRIGHYINGVFTCIQCKDTSKDITQKCMQCETRFYYDLVEKKCLQCNSACITCEGTTNNCTECLHSDQNVPQCNCILENYYQDNNNQCQECSSKCKTCMNDSNYCLSCSSTLKTLPNCDCPSGYSSIGSECIQQFNCSSKCQTCSLSPENCELCSQDRINPPLCSCQYGFSEDSNGDCVPCSLNQYYDMTTRSCIQCASFCYECDLTQCKKCQQGLKLIENECSCNDSLVPYQKSLTEIVCLQGMDLDIQISLKQNTYSIQFLFDHNLQALDLSILSSSDFNEIMNFYLPEINQSYYQFVNPRIKNNQLSVQLNIFKNINVSEGYALIKSNQHFISSDTEWILKSQYINKMLPFKIGHFLLTNIENSSLDSLNNQLQSFQSSNSGIFSIINQLQLVFYLLNTLQPISVFLLLNTNYPPTLYKFYQFIGTFVFPVVPNYQTTDYVKKDFYLLGMKIEKADRIQPTYGNYQKLGFLLSFLINIPIVVIKYFIMICILGLTYYIKTIKIPLKEKLSSINTILIQRLNSDLEASLLIIVVSIYVQFQDIEQVSYLYRVGFYLAILFILMQSILFYYNFTNVMNMTTDKKQQSALFLERIQDTSSKLQRSYFILQLIKKYLYVSIAYFFFNYPILTCIFNGSLLFFSSLSLIKFKVYENKISKIIKFLGDFLLSIVWFLHIAIVKVEGLIKLEIVIDSQLLEKYVTLGNVSLILLMIINIVFLMKIFISIYSQLKEFFSKKSDSNEKTHTYISKKKTSEMVKIS